MNAGQVYNTLGRLESAGLVSGEEVPQQGRPDRRVYRITDAGRAELAGWVTRPVPATRFGDEFFFKLAFAGLGGLAEPEALIEERQAECLQALRDTDAVARPGTAARPPRCSPSAPPRIWRPSCAGWTRAGSGSHERRAGGSRARPHVPGHAAGARAARRRPDRRDAASS